MCALHSFDVSCTMPKRANKYLMDGSSMKDQRVTVTFNCKYFYKINSVSASLNFLTGKFT